MFRVTIRQSMTEGMGIAPRSRHRVVGRRILQTTRASCTMVVTPGDRSMLTVRIDGHCKVALALIWLAVTAAGCDGTGMPAASSGGRTASRTQADRPTGDSDMPSAESEGADAKDPRYNPLSAAEAWVILQKGT